MFVGEAVIGWMSESTGLLADSLDMLADALVYTIALIAVGRSNRLQSSAAATSGVLQIALGLGVLFEVGRRYLYGSEPLSVAIMATGAVALVANVACLAILAKHRNGGAHMRASWIFSTNDVIANMGVILSGGLVLLLGSRIPDLVVGGLISVVVLRGGVQILWAPHHKVQQH
jgi:Co/Zn/Cd efflux system component